MLVGIRSNGENQLTVTYPKIKAVKGGVEIISRSKAIHFQGHFSQKQTQEHKLCRVCFQNQEKLFTTVINIKGAMNYECVSDSVTYRGPL